jgi:hypothetical protein
MIRINPRTILSLCRRALSGTALSLVFAALALLAAPAVSQAQTTMVGSLANFDALNDTGQETHGFEIQLEGISSADIVRIFGGANIIRYGQGTATDYPGGVYVRWMSPYDPATQTFTQSTPAPLSLKTVPGESCWIPVMGAAYYSAGCEHFGVSSVRNPTNVTYHWLVEDPQNPGTLVRYGSAVGIPAPTWTVVQPVQPGNPPVVVAEIAAPPAAEPVFQYGDAEWVKVYKTELPREVQLEELMGDNAAVVPEQPAQAEVSWDLIQQDPQVGKQKQKGRLVNQGNLGNGSRAVVRRYEYYKYTGAYDPMTHEALCGGDGTCSAPLDGELGDAIGAQNAAANVAVPSVTVADAGNGLVSSADKVISCGSKCVGNYTLGTVVTLTAKPASNNIFTGWSGACSGTQLTCSVTVNDALTVTATFAAAPAQAGGGGGGGAVGGGGGGGGGGAAGGGTSGGGSGGGGRKP